jgi:hypothetical protein
LDFTDERKRADGSTDSVVRALLLRAIQASLLLIPKACLLVVPLEHRIAGDPWRQTHAGCDPISNPP